MKRYYDRTWKIGELAKIFNVNVQLLRHYDKEGLLVPEIRNPASKWRTYRYDQIYALGMIRLLRHMGCSLDEIGDFMHGRNADLTEVFINEKLDQTLAKYEKLLSMKNVINDRFAMIRSESKYDSIDQFYIISDEEIHYIETAGLEGVFADELFYMYPTLVSYKGQERRFAIKLPPEEAGEFKDKIHTIPLGDYMVGYHHGSYEDIYETFDRMRAASDGLLEDGSRLDDEIITVNIIDQLIEENRDNYITKVMIKILH